MATTTTLNMTETKEMIKASFKQFMEFKKAGLTSTSARPLPLCLWGVKGIGKTSIVKAAAKELEEELNIIINLTARQLSVAQPFDIGGYPQIVQEKINGKVYNIQRFAVPEFLVDKGNKDGKEVWTFLFLDEINRARPEMHNAIMGLLDGRGSNEHPMPEQMFVIGAANPANEKYGAVTEINDEAIQDRMVHINVATSRSETVAYMFNDKTIDRSMFHFLNDDDARIQDKKFESITAELQFSDRGQTHVARMVPFLLQIKEPTLRENLLRAYAKGLLGNTQGELFVDKMHTYYSIVSAEEIINKFLDEKAGVKEKVLTLVMPDESGANRLDSLDKVNNQVKITINNKNRAAFTGEQLANLKAYLDTIPKDNAEKLLGCNFKPEELAYLSDVVTETMTREAIDVNSIVGQFR